MGPLFSLANRKMVRPYIIIIIIIIIITFTIARPSGRAV
jgi:preprotein translocase subunit YajC